MNNYLDSFSKYLLELSLRERVLFLFVSIAIIYAVWDGVIFSPQADHYQELLGKQQQLINQQQQLERSIAESTAKIESNKRTQQQQKHSIEEFKQKSLESNEALNNILTNLVPPTKITEFLHSLVLQTHGLKLLELNNEEVEIISLTDIEPEEKSLQEGNPRSVLYKHATTIKLSGSYQQLYNYLETLEDSQWNLYWENLDYHVAQYPLAEITVRVYTVSADQHWIGL